MKVGHWHGDAVHVLYTALGVMIAFQVIRLAAGRLAESDSQGVANVGKAVGGLFSFPAQ